jgi:WD40 repeat protein/serine/threonine protein kinase
MNMSDPAPEAPDSAARVDDEHDEPLDSRLPDVLAAYDELLAIGVKIASDSALTAAIDAELKDAKACLQILEQVWPRSGEQSANQNHLGEGDSPIFHRGLGKIETVPDGSESGPVARTLGQFEILCELGRGGGGIVFLAVDSELGRKVALKVPYPEVLVRRDLRRRFVQEAQAAAQLVHPNIVPVHSTGEIGPICYIASAYCDGPTLAEWLKERSSPVPFQTAAELVAALADAVEHAHIHGILHRDIKPSNVLLEEGVGCQVSGVSEKEDKATGGQGDNETGGGGQSPFLRAKMGTDPEPVPVPKLTDFGLAKLLEVERDATRTGAVLGTPAYMAPEQAEGRLADISVATDVYGLGVVLYELIAGRPPFQGNSDVETPHAIMHDDPPPLRTLRSRSWIRQNSGILLKFGNFSYGIGRVPRDLEAICLKCLEKNPTNRYSRAAELAADLRRFLDGRPTIVRPVGWGKRAVKWARRRPAVAGTCATLLLAAAIATFGLVGHAKRVEQIRASANARIQRQSNDERERQRQYDYATHIQGAYQAWQSTDLKSAIELLDLCRPQPAEEDLRGWEWYYVRRLCAGGIVTLRGHDGPVLGAVFAPNGQHLASCGADGTLRIWNVASGTLKATIPAHKSLANAVAWSSDGLLLATVGDDAHVRVWDAGTFKLRAQYPRASGQTLSQNRPRDRYTAIPPRTSLISDSQLGAKLLTVAFSVDGQSIAAAGEEGVIRLWDVATGEVIRTIKGHTDTINYIAFATDGNRIASGSVDRTARVWQLDSPSEPIAVLEPDAPVVSVAFSPDGATLATADSQITLWDLPSRTMKVRMNAHRNEITSITFSPTGQTIASAASDMMIHTWDVTTSVSTAPGDIFHNTRSNLLNTYRGHTNAVVCLAFSPHGDRLASAGKDGTIQIWDSTGAQDRQLLRESTRLEIFGLAFSPIGTSLAVASQPEKGSELLIWRSLGNDPAFTIPIEGKINIKSVGFSADGHRVAFAENAGPIMEYLMARGKTRLLVSENELYTDCGYSPDNQHFAVASNEWNSARVLDTATGEVIARIPGQRTIAISPNGRLIATESSDLSNSYSVELWDISAGRSAGRLVGHTGQIASIVFSADGRLLATGSADGTARIWNVENGMERFVLRAHEDGISNVAFLEDDKSLATASVDETMKIWDVLTGRLLLSLDLDGSVTGMSVSADGRTIATASRDADGIGRVDLWHAPVE